MSIAVISAPIGDWHFRIDPTSIQWPFTAKTNVTPTIGGKVVQIFGVQLGDITVSGSFGSKGGGLGEQQRFLAYLKGLTPIGVDITHAISPIRFIYPVKAGWDFQVYIKSFMQTGTSTSIEATPQIFNPQWTITMFPNQENGKFKTAASNAILNSLATGLGWTAGSYQYSGQNIPIFETIATEQGNAGGSYIDQYNAAFKAGQSSGTKTQAYTTGGGAPTGGGSTVTSADPNMTILGPSSLTAAQILAWWNNHHGGNARLTTDISQIINDYVSYGQEQNVRGDVAFAQACWETGYFTNNDTALNNFAGIGHPVSAASGLDFNSADDGVLAQIQLLYTIATNSTTFANPKNISPGWGGKYVTTWAGLSGNWAADTNYANEIMSVYSSMLGG